MKKTFIHMAFIPVLLSEWDGPTPGARCEVFISQIPRDTYEDLLIPLFSSVGPLWEFRLMMNFSGQNRGFAYAKYGSPAMASSAVHMLHGHILKPGFHLSVRRSTEKRHLCMGGLPAVTKPGDLLQVQKMWLYVVMKCACFLMILIKALLLSPLTNYLFFE